MRRLKYATCFFRYSFRTCTLRAQCFGLIECQLAFTERLTTDIYMYRYIHVHIYIYLKIAPFDSLVWGSLRLTPIICIVLKLSVRDIAIQQDFPNKKDQCIQSSTETILLFTGSALYGLNILKKVHLLCPNCI